MLKTSSFQFMDIECYPNYFLLIAFGSGSPNSALIKEYIKADIKKDKKRKDDLLTQIDYHKFELVFNDDTDITQFRETLIALGDFCKGKTLIAHNGMKYDFVLIDFILYRLENLIRLSPKDVLDMIYELNDMIIKNKDIWIYNLHEDLQQLLQEKWKRPFNRLDTLKSLFESVARKSAKQTAIMLKWHRIQDLPIEPGTIITKDMLYNMVDYCINDTLIIWKFFYHKIDEIMLKIAASARFGIDALNLNRSALADAFLMKRYEEESGESQWIFKNKQTPRNKIALKRLLWDGIKFKTKPFQDMYNDVYNTIIDTNSGKSFEKVFIHNGTKYVIATGGLHSGDRPAIFKAGVDYTLRDVDADSFYPREVIMLEIAPAHVNKTAFIRIFTEPVTLRLKAKAETKTYYALAKKEKDADAKKEYLRLADEAKLFNEFFKIVINSGGFGKLGYDGWLLDKAALYKVTMNCQMLLLMLVESLELAGFNCISANTDGIVAKVPIGRDVDYYAVCDEWCKATGHTVEYTDYDRYVRMNVNSYAAVKTSYKTSKNNKDIKLKGGFITDIDVNKGYSMPIVAKAIFAYYIHDTPIRQFLETYTGDDDEPPIYDFCISQKVGNDYRMEYQQLQGSDLVTIPLQKNVRYFVSKTGVVLTKVKKNERGDDTRRTRLVANQYVTIFNDYYEADMKDYNINYNFYVSQVMKIVNDIDNLITKKMKTRSGTMFDEL